MPDTACQSTHRSQMRLVIRVDEGPGCRLHPRQRLCQTHRPYSIRTVKSCSTTRTDNPSIVWVQRERGLRFTRVRGVPLASEALSLGDPGGIHLACSKVASFDGALSILTGHS